MMHPSKCHEPQGDPALRRGSLVPGLLLAGLAFLAWASPARAWWDGDWTLRKQITLDTTSSGSAIADPIGSSPVLIRLFDGNFRFSDAKSDGTDLRFVAADDKTLLAYHIEKFDSLLDEAFVWVNVPDLKPGTKTTFWLYYGNTGNKAVKVESAKDTYDADTVLVYHFNAAGQPSYDFTGQGNNAQNAGLPVDGSLIGSGIRLDGRAAINIAPSPSLVWTEGAQWTWSAWVKFGAPQSNGIFFNRGDHVKFLAIGADQGSPFLVESDGGPIVRSAAGAPVAPNTWHPVAVVAAGGKITLYLDGTPYSTVDASLPALDTPMAIGGDGWGGLMIAGGTGFLGEMDEMQISKVARPAGYLKLSAVEQGGDTASKVLAFGEDEQQTGWFDFLKKGYVGVIIGSLTADGWVVIGILAVMSLISWLVMIGKAKYLNQVSRSNELFLKEWRKVAADLSVLDNGDGNGAAAGVTKEQRLAARHSPLYRIYHIGVEEIQHRLAADKASGTRKAISGRSIAAIRASLDGGMVRESQRLSSQMVLLTIAISGGPFLGLLGTVVGVMITFAAVAQAGDVNVNAIAPGIAAALAATVAGLAVAIPALFGYNYLVTQIKSATSDVHVFIDEFVTKLAEFYGGKAE
jgi:biopolymer transport protein ExbB